jgi:hypothetical protein
VGDIILPSPISFGGNMPFIKSVERRKELDQVYGKMVHVDVKADGDLNYILYKFCKYNVAQNC